MCVIFPPLFLLYKLISISSKQCQLNYSIKLKSPEINQAFAIIRIKVSQARKTMDRPSNFRKSRQESIMWRETEQYFHNPIGIRQSTFRLAHRPYIPCRWSRTIYIHIYDFPWGKNHRSWRNLRAHYSWFTRLSASDTTRYRANHQYNREKDHFPISRVYIEASSRYFITFVGIIATKVAHRVPFCRAFSYHGSNYGSPLLVSVSKADVLSSAFPAVARVSSEK